MAVFENVDLYPTPREVIALDDLYKVLCNLLGDRFNKLPTD